MDVFSHKGSILNIDLIWQIYTNLYLCGVCFFFLSAYQEKKI